MGTVGFLAVCALVAVVHAEITQLPPTGVNWNKRGQDELKEQLKAFMRWNPAKNVIVFLGDGMGVSTVTAARIFKAQQKSQSVTEGALEWESFPFVGLAKTYNTDTQTPDSAGTATAFLCGEKTRAAVIGVNEKVPRWDCSKVAGNEIKSFIHHAMEKDKWGGIVTTTRITHATPSSAYAHSADRYWEDDDDLPPECLGVCKDIADQLVTDDPNPNIKVLMGGGRRHLMTVDESDPEYPDKMGRRTDGRNLIEEWKTMHAGMVGDGKWAYVENKTDLNNLDCDKVEYLMGLFEWENMKYETERREEIDGEPWTEPSLAEMTSKAIDVLSKSEEGYTLLVEGGRIDHAHHDAKAYKALVDTMAFEAAVKVAMEKTNEEDTLIVVTADHSHVFTMSGDQKLDNDILGIVEDSYGNIPVALDGKPWQVLQYANGPGFAYHRTDGTGNWTHYNETPRLDLSTLTLEEMKDKDFLQDSPIPFEWETHGGEDVGIYARGCMSHLFTGVHEQHYIAHAVMYAQCVGPNTGLCDDPPATCAATTTTALVAMTTSLVLLGLALSKCGRN